MSKKEVCKFLNISLSTLLRLMNSGKIPYYKNGTSRSSKVTFKRVEVVKYLNSIKKN